MSLYLYDAKDWNLINNCTGSLSGRWGMEDGRICIKKKTNIGKDSYCVFIYG
jgi:hypothetical protein